MASSVSWLAPPREGGHWGGLRTGHCTLCTHQGPPARAAHCVSRTLLGGQLVHTRPPYVPSNTHAQQVSDVRVRKVKASVILFSIVPRVALTFLYKRRRHSNFYLDDMTSREQMENARFTKAKDAAAVWIGLRCVGGGSCPPAGCAPGMGGRRGLS